MGCSTSPPTGGSPANGSARSVGQRPRIQLPDRAARGGRRAALALPTRTDPARPAQLHPRARGWSPTTASSSRLGTDGHQRAGLRRGHRGAVVDDGHTKRRQEMSLGAMIAGVVVALVAAASASAAGAVGSGDQPAATALDGAVVAATAVVVTMVVVDDATVVVAASVGGVDAAGAGAGNRRGRCWLRRRSPCTGRPAARGHRAPAPPPACTVRQRCRVDRGVPPVVHHRHRRRARDASARTSPSSRRRRAATRRRSARRGRSPARRRPTPTAAWRSSSRGCRRCRPRAW